MRFFGLVGICGVVYWHQLGSLMFLITLSGVYVKVMIFFVCLCGEKKTTKQYNQIFKYGSIISIPI